MRHGSGILAVEPEPSEVFLPPVNDSIRLVSMHVVCVPSDPAVEHRCGRAYCAGCCGCFVSMGAWRPQMNERIKQSRAQTCAASRLEVCGLLWPLGTTIAAAFAQRCSATLDPPAAHAALLVTLRRIFVASRRRLRARRPGAVARRESAL